METLRLRPLHRAEGTGQGPGGPPRRSHLGDDALRLVAAGHGDADEVEATEKIRVPMIWERTDSTVRPRMMIAAIPARVR